MYQFNVEGVTVTDQRLSVHGVWDLGGTKRFQVIHLPIEWFSAGPILDQLQRSAVVRAKHVDADWEQFLLWG